MKLEVKIEVDDKVTVSNLKDYLECFIENISRRGEVIDYNYFITIKDFEFKYGCSDNENYQICLNNKMENLKKIIEIYLKDYSNLKECTRYVLWEKSSCTSRIESETEELLKYIYTLYKSKKVDFDKYQELRYKVEELFKDIDKKVLKDDFVVYVPRETIK